MEELTGVANEIQHTIQMGEREFNMPMYGTKEEFLFVAVQEAFEEIDRLKKQNQKLNDKINSILKK